MLWLPLQASADKPKNVLDVKTTISDPNIVYPESYETDTEKMLQGWYLQNYTAGDDRYRTQPDVEVSDEQYRDRLAKLNTVIELPYNSIVRQYIERYTKRGRAQVAALLGLSNYYMPIFEQALEEQGLPLELKYLPVIESALDPNAVSRHGATGLWQFMLASGRGNGLEVSSLVDERRDPYRSSEAAARYLKDLHKSYNDWGLAIAAYNCGPGTVNKAIRRAGGDPSQHDYWSIYHYLPAETRGYVPMFIAANYVMNYYPYHNISPVLATKPLVTDTLMISNRVHFDQISKILNIPVDELRVLNPQFRADIIPGHADKMYTLVLPSQQIHAYIMSESDILAYNADKYRQRLTAEPGSEPEAEADAREEIEDKREEIAENKEEPAKKADVADEPVKKAAANPAPARKSTSSTRKGATVTHKVEPGESLTSISEKYGVSIEEIKDWNGLTRNSLRTGQQLRINTSQEIADHTGSRAATKKKETTPAKVETTKTEITETKARGKKAKAETTANTSKKSKKAKKEAAAPKSHSVNSGENLTTIARKYGTTVEALKKANGLKGDELHPGDKLKLPTGSKDSKASTSKSSKKGKAAKTGKKKKRR